MTKGAGFHLWSRPSSVLFFHMKPWNITVVILLLWPFFLQSAPAEDLSSKAGASFTFSHGKAETCGADWLFMENIIEENNAGCREVLKIRGFPYLRGTPPVLKMAQELSSRYAQHEWLELLRRIDLQARYAELSRLPGPEIERFCNHAGIECFRGRIRSYVARCSAIIMGDEKRNHGFMKILKMKAMESIRNPEHGSRACFQDGNSLDGLVTDDVLNRVMSPPRSGGSGSASYLERRIQRSKQAGRP